jgi:hypothetical protein
VLEAVELLLQRRTRQSGHDFSPDRAKGLSEVYRRFQTADNRNVESRRGKASGVRAVNAVIGSNRWLTDSVVPPPAVTLDRPPLRFRTPTAQPAALEHQI